MLTDAVIQAAVQAALAEDAPWGDATSDGLLPAGTPARLAIRAKSPGVLCGLPLAEAVFRAVEPALRWEQDLADGAALTPGAVAATVSGDARRLLRGERVALNFLTHLSGVATATAAVVRALEGTGCRLRDTRKMLPGLRALQKHAVRMGGGTSHRADLAEAVLIKDNHLAALRTRGLGPADAVRLARESNPGLRIEIEVTTAEEAREALAAGADELLLDNMDVATMREVVALAAKVSPRPALEASGGITLENARAVAETGVDYISMGAITHSAPALDMSLEVEAG
jgi:nicotinate-nucleotide pyrophosphorylase (carboxylating)